MLGYALAHSPFFRLPLLSSPPSFFFPPSYLIPKILEDYKNDEIALLNNLLDKYGKDEAELRDIAEDIATNTAGPTGSVHRRGKLQVSVPELRAQRRW
jgi:hypothetical protein